MIKNWLLTGDSHGRTIDRIAEINTTQYIPKETGIIILGDAGINFYLNKSEQNRKQQLQDTGFTFFCVRGNHEERPENLGMRLRPRHQDDYWGEFYWEDEFPNILYFANWGLYRLGKYHVYEIGGAYSVDKYYRLLNAPNPAKWSGWFEDEQLTIDEMLECQEDIYNLPRTLHLDFVFTHTCPIHWEPTDLFLSAIDQSTVDKTMENWLQEIEIDLRPYSVWCFGHYHADRMEMPHVLQMFKSIMTLDEVYSLWDKEGNQNEEYWYIPKSPYYYEGQK